MRVAEHDLIFVVGCQRHVRNHLRSIFFGQAVVAHVEVDAGQQGPACRCRSVIHVGVARFLERRLRRVDVLDDPRVCLPQGAPGYYVVETYRACGQRDSQMRGVRCVGVSLAVGVAEVQEHQRTDEIGVCDDPVDLGHIARIALFQGGTVMDDVVGIGYHAVSPSPHQTRIAGIVLGQGQKVVNIRLHFPGIGGCVREVARQVGIIDRIVVVKRVGGAVYAVVRTLQSLEFREEGRNRAFADFLDFEEAAATG